MAQDFFASLGHDGVGQIGTETTINSGDIAGILMIAVQALEKRTAELKQRGTHSLRNWRAGATAEALYPDNSRATRLLKLTGMVLTTACQAGCVSGAGGETLRLI